MKKLRVVLTFGVLFALLLGATTSALGGQEKVDVCHITGTYDFGSGPVDIGHVITIADPAYESHIAHGDPEVWNVAILPDGSEVCVAGDATRLVFVTSGTWNGDLGGLAGADAKCQAAADAANLSGTYKAWLSDSTAWPADGSRFTQSTGPYVLVGGTTVIADDWTDLTTCDPGCLQAPINRDEDGSLVPDDDWTWTATNPDGTFSGGGNCDGWTTADAGWYQTPGGWWEFVNGAATGDTDSTNHSWSAATYQLPCGPNPDDPSGPSYEQHLYCFQQ